MLAKLSLSHVTHLTWIVEDSRSLRSFDIMSCQCQRSAHMATKCSNMSKHSTLAGFQASISCISSGRSWMVNSGRRSLRLAVGFWANSNSSDEQFGQLMQKSDSSSTIIYNSFLRSMQVYVYFYYINLIKQLKPLLLVNLLLTVSFQSGTKDRPIKIQKFPLTRICPGIQVVYYNGVPVFWRHP